MKYLILLATAYFIGNSKVSAQKINIKSYQVSYSILDRDPYRNNPITLAPLLKNKTGYDNLINSINHNEVYGNPSIEKIKNFSLSIELSKQNFNSFFWRHFSIRLGVGLSNKIRKNGMGLVNNEVINYDTINYRKIRSEFWIINASRQLSFITGLTYKKNIFKHVKFATGFVFQPNITLSNNFSSNIDTTFFKKDNTINIKYGGTNEAKGISVFTYNLYIPLGLNVNVYREQLFIQSSVNIGFLFSKYYLDTNKKEANGIEFSIIYQPEKQAIPLQKTQRATL